MKTRKNNDLVPATNHPTVKGSLVDGTTPVVADDLKYDASSLLLVATREVPDGKLMKAQKGLDLVMAELTKLVQSPDKLPVGISLEELQQVTNPAEAIALIDAHLPKVLDTYHILITTRARLEDERQRGISNLAAVVDLRIQRYGKKELLSMFAHTRAYRSAAAKKAVRTRRRNAAIKAADEGQPVSNLPAGELPETSSFQQA